MLGDVGGSSEENIPASQEATQRYLSQRSTIASTLGRTQSRNTSVRPPKSYFELVLIKSGVLLDEADNFILCMYRYLKYNSENINNLLHINISL